MSAFPSDKRAQAKVLGIALVGRVTEFFRDEANRKEFDEWYFRKYGTKYKWKKD